MPTRQFVIALLLIVQLNAIAKTPSLPSRATIFSTANSRPTVSPSGEWIAELGSLSGTIRLTGTSSSINTPKVIGLAASRIYWYRWSSSTDHLLVSAEKDGIPAIYKVSPTGTAEKITEKLLDPVINIASPTNGYAFTVDRFKSNAPEGIVELDRAGNLVSVSSRDNLVPPTLAAKGAFLNYRSSPQGPTYTFGTDPATRGSIRISGIEQRRGAGLVSITGNGKAFLLAGAGSDTIGLLELDLFSGIWRIVAQESVDLTRVILNPLDLSAEAVEFELERPTTKILQPEIQKDINRLTAVKWGYPKIVDRSLNDNFWLIKYGSQMKAPIWAIYNRLNSTIVPVNLSTPVFASWNVFPFTIDRLSEPTIRGYISLPRPELCRPRGCPLVYKLHGGPGARDFSEVDQERTWLLSRGIAVASLNYRGSRGFGKKYEELDRKQWTTGIPRDVSDGLSYILKSYPIDESRVAVVGSSFAGLLALDLASQSPVVKCGIVDSMTADLVNFVDEGIKAHGSKSDLIERLGDVRVPQIRGQVSAASPVMRVELLKKLSLLHFQGEEDKTTPAENVKVFVEKMLASNPEYTFLSVPLAGHGLLGARSEYVAVAERFLANCLSVPFEPIGTELSQRKQPLKMVGKPLPDSATSVPVRPGR